MIQLSFYFVDKTPNNNLHYLPTVEKIGNIKASCIFLSKLETRRYIWAEFRVMSELTLLLFYIE